MDQSDLNPRSRSQTRAFFLLVFPPHPGLLSPKPEPRIHTGCSGGQVDESYLFEGRKEWSTHKIIPGKGTKNKTVKTRGSQNYARMALCLVKENHEVTKLHCRLGPGFAFVMLVNKS